MPSSSVRALPRRFAVSLLALVLALCCLPPASKIAQAQTIDQGTCGNNATWTLDENGTLTVSGTGPMDNYTQDDWAPWTSEARKVTSIVVSDGVTAIGDYAFWYCVNAVDVSLPGSVTSLGINSFAQCTSLTQISIPQGVTTIGGRAFIGCASLTDVVLPESLQEIKGMAFSNCENLEAIAIPSNVAFLGNDVFNGCAGLVDVSLPNSLTHLGDGAFANCSSLESITIPFSVASVPNSGFWGCTKLSSVKLQEGATEICWGCFSDCPALTSIAVPRTVTTIEEGAVGMFYNYDDEQFDSVDGFVVYGYSDTAAQDYAASNNLTFVAIDSRSGGNCREVQVAGHNDSRALTTFEDTRSGLTILLNGVTEENAQNLADAIAENNASNTPVKFINSDFVDADKYSTIYHGYDSLHCWLSSASNTLLISGWSSGLTNPLLDQEFDSEDNLFIFFSSNMTDTGGAIVQKAYSYFFDGLYASAASGRSATPTTEATAAKPSVGIAHTGFIPQLCSEALLRTADLSSDPQAVSLLNDFAGHAYEMILSGEGASHSVTVVGAVIDQAASGTDHYRALLIADSDNEVSSSIGQPATMEEAYGARRAKTNSYTMYFLEEHEVRGEMRLCLKDYNGAGTYTPIDTITSLAFRSDESYAAALETAPHATRDASSAGDISLHDMAVLDDEFEERNSFKPNESIQLIAHVISLNDKVSFNAETTGSNVLENRLDIYRNEELVASLSEEASLDLTTAVIDGQIGEAINIDLTQYCSEPGNYSIKLHLNSANLPEAYVSNNNSPFVCAFKVTDPEVKPDPGKDDPKPVNPGDDARDQGKSAIPSTGDGTTPVLTIIFALMALSSVILVAYRLRTPLAGKEHRHD